MKFSSRAIMFRVVPLGDISVLPVMSRFGLCIPIEEKMRNFFPMIPTVNWEAHKKDIFPLLNNYFAVGKFVYFAPITVNWSDNIESIKRRKQITPTKFFSCGDMISFAVAKRKQTLFRCESQNTILYDQTRTNFVTRLLGATV